MDMGSFATQGRSPGRAPHSGAGLVVGLSAAWQHPMRGCKHWQHARTAWPACTCKCLGSAHANHWVGCQPDHACIHPCPCMDTLWPATQTNTALQDAQLARTRHAHTHAHTEQGGHKRQPRDTQSQGVCERIPHAQRSAPCTPTQRSSTALSTSSSGNSSRAWTVSAARRPHNISQKRCASCARNTPYVSLLLGGVFTAHS